MSRLLVLLFAGGIVVLGFQPIQREYGSFSNFASAVAGSISEWSAGFSVEKWAKELENRRTSSRTEVESKKPDREQNTSSSSEPRTSWFSRFLPKPQEGQGDSQEKRPEQIPQDKLTADDREELNDLLNNF